jgi:intergrase/recombinase
MDIVKSFLAEYGFSMLYAVITGIAAFVGLRIKKLYEEKCNNDTKKKVVSDCVKAVEQLYSELKGSEKLERAKDSIQAILADKGISISDLEMDILIESVVAEFNLNDLKIRKDV